ncbi:MAG: hypothetical protein S0880_11825 [Actinomycetota bacterium]|nr:hypothetical protein [Actinomycetota bacterium]
MRRRAGMVAAVCALVTVTACGTAGAGSGSVSAASSGELYTMAPYEGVGAWVDVFDWTAEYNRGNPEFVAADVDTLADLGVETLYIQTSRYISPHAVMEVERLEGIIDRAHGHGMAVVGWYLPELEDVGSDLIRFTAAANLLDLDGLAVDIEPLLIGEANNVELVELTERLDAEIDGVIGGIVVPPVVTDVINTDFWPDFPWDEIRDHYDVWLPMSYWSNRPESNPYHDAERYTRENIERLRDHVGDDAPIHNIGGISHQVDPYEVRQMVQAARAEDALGVSFYDVVAARSNTRLIWFELMKW